MELFDIVGMTELYGPGTVHRMPGPRLHSLLVRLLTAGDSGPGNPAAGAGRRVGRDVITTLAKEAAPLIRYRTRTSPASSPAVHLRHDYAAALAPQRPH